MELRFKKMRCMFCGMSKSNTSKALGKFKLYYNPKRLACKCLTCGKRVYLDLMEENKNVERSSV